MDNIVEPLDVDVYRRHALLNFIRKNKIANDYLKYSDVDTMTEEVLQKFYRVHQQLQSKIIFIKLGKGLVKQSLLFAKSKLESKIPALKYISPDNLVVEVSEDEYIALLSQIKEEQNKETNLYFLITKNMIVSLLNIDLVKFNESIEADGLSFGQMEKLMSNIINPKKPVPTPDVETIVEVSPALNYASMQRKRSLEDDELPQSPKRVRFEDHIEPEIIETIEQEVVIERVPEPESNVVVESNVVAESNVVVESNVVESNVVIIESNEEMSDSGTESDEEPPPRPSIQSDLNALLAQLGDVDSGEEEDEEEPEDSPKINEVEPSSSTTVEELLKLVNRPKSVPTARKEHHKMHFEFE